MALAIPTGFGSAALVFTGAAGTQPYVTTIGVDLSAAGGNFVAAANKVMVNYGTAFANQWSAALTLDHVTLSVGQDGPGGSVDSDAQPIGSSRTGAFPPTALACIARKITNELGRRGRGRMFLPGILSENEVDEDGSVTPARRTAVNTLLTNFVAQLNDDLEGFALPPVLLHSAPPVGPVEAPSPITRMTVSDTVGWIRGRIR